jgi:hypothetical protein
MEFKASNDFWGVNRAWQGTLEAVGFDLFLTSSAGLHFRRSAEAQIAVAF